MIEMALETTPRARPGFVAVLPPAPLPPSVMELQHAFLREEVRDRLKMQESLAQAIFRALMLANGGAIIALFTLIGSKADIAEQVAGPSLWFAFGAFAVGLAATILSNVSAFFMQIHYATMTERQMWNNELELAGRPASYDVESCLAAGDRWEKAAIAAVGVSLAFFVLGATLCLLSFLS